MIHRFSVEKGVKYQEETIISVLYPVLLKVPETYWQLKLKDKTIFLGRYARQSLRISGEYSGFYPEQLKKNKNGKPLSCDGIYWSVSHKPGCTAGIVARSDTGIDIEKIKPVSIPLFRRICSTEEKDLFKTDNMDLVFFRCFTSKEAVLKLIGTGLQGMKGVKIIEVPDNLNTVLMAGGDIYRVEHFIVDGYISSVVKGDSRVIWDYIGPDF